MSDEPGAGWVEIGAMIEEMEAQREAVALMRTNSSIEGLQWAFRFRKPGERVDQAKCYYGASPLAAVGHGFDAWKRGRG